MWSLIWRSCSTHKLNGVLDFGGCIARHSERLESVLYEGCLLKASWPWIVQYHCWAGKITNRFFFFFACVYMKTIKWMRTNGMYLVEGKTLTGKRSMYWSPPPCLSGFSMIKLICHMVSNVSCCLPLQGCHFQDCTESVYHSIIKKPNQTEHQKSQYRSDFH